MGWMTAFWLCYGYYSISFNMLGCFGIDCCVNVVALYLQYSFAAEKYDKYCGNLACCCEWIITRDMEHSVRERSVSMSAHSSSKAQLPVSPPSSNKVDAI